MSITMIFSTNDSTNIPYDMFTSLDITNIPHLTTKYRYTGIWTRYISASINIIFFIDHKLKTANKKAKYIRIITTERPHKKEIKRG